MREPSKEQIKERTKHLRQVLKEKHKIDLPQGHALEIMAKVFGFKDWNTASALASNQQSEPQTIEKKESTINQELPPAIKLQKAGDYADFFSRFDRNKEVFTYEYKKTDLGQFVTPTSICSLVYDSEVQNEADIRLELHTETEKNLQHNDFGKSSSHKFEITKLERLQRNVKWFNMKNGGFWSPSNYLYKAEK